MVPFMSDGAERGNLSADPVVSSGGVTTTAGAAAPAAVAPASAAKRWTVGTLRYTTAGLALVLFWLLLGTLGASFRDRAAGDMVSLLLRRLGASNIALMVLTVVIPTAISVIFLPTIGYKSDRFRSRWGRRAPFLLVATPVAAAVMVGTAFTPELGGMLRGMFGSGPLAGANFALIVFGLFSAMGHFATLTTGMAFPALVNDVVPRPIMGRTFSLFRVISLLCGILMNYVFFRYYESHFQPIFLVLALFFFTAYMLMAFMVKEGEYPPPDDAAAVDDIRAAGFFAAMKIYLRECLSMPYYRWVIAALALAALAGGPVNWYSTWYMKSLGMDLGDYGKVKAINHTCGLLLAFPIGMLVDKVHVLRVSMVTMGMYAVTLMLGAIFIRSPWSFGWAVFGHMVVAGFFLSASGALAPLLLPRLKFAQFHSAAVVVTSIATIIMSLVMGWILDHTGSNYRLTYVASSALAFATLAVMIVVYRKFMALGGPRGYIAPEVKPGGGNELIRH